MKHRHADTKKHANTFAVLGQYLTALVLIGYRRFAPRMGEELTRITHIEQPFGAELDWYVENVVLPQAHALGDGAPSWLGWSRKRRYGETLKTTRAALWIWKPMTRPSRAVS
jgi:hypothetical protein